MHCMHPAGVAPTPLQVDRAWADTQRMRDSVSPGPALAAHRTIGSGAVADAAAPLIARLRRAMRTQVLVLAFYLVDTLFMAAFAVHGSLPAAAPVAYGAAGCGLTALFAWVLRRGLHRRMGGIRFTSIQLLSACGLMLVTAAAVPQIGLLLLLTLIVALATAALQLPLRDVLAVSAAIAAMAVGLMLLNGKGFGAPMDDAWSRLLSGLWFTFVLAKIAVINLIGAEMRQALSTSNAQLGVALVQLRELSERDELTGLQNRRSVLALLARERERFARGGPAFALAILDVDHFKHVNDRFGHAMGDAVLRAFAEQVARGLRGGDCVARYGGEEFLLVLPDVGDEASAVQAAERLRCAVSDHRWSELATGLTITCSIGVTMSRPGEDVASVLARADTALYRAKTGGRNAVRVV